MASLVTVCEDRMGANITRDPNKIRIFTEGIDGHSLAACYYFKDELERRGIEIDLNDPESVNSIKKLAPDLRQQGKAVTFGANYGATEYAVSRSLKISKEEARQILDNYWKLYTKTKEYWDKVEQEVLKKGYIKGAFGLKARGDLANILNQAKYSSALRSLVNMTIQSFALLLYRTVFELQNRIEKMGYQNDIRIYNTVYDAIYIYVRPEPELVKWLNDNLIEIMTWDYDPTFPVKNEAEMEIGYNQAELIVVPNNASLEKIRELLNSL